MAKKVKASGGAMSFLTIGKMLDDIAKKVPIVIEKEVKAKRFISTGCYITDAALSGRLIGGGIASNRITAFAGESGAGKSFFAYATAASAQKEGYSILYIDTEGAIDLEDFPKYEVDISPEKFSLIRSNKVEDVNIALSQIIDNLLDAKRGGHEIPKIVIMLDSLGQMASKKEKEDLIKGEIKQDMTKAKAMGSLFRSINMDLFYLDIPLLVCNHTYKTMDLFPQEVLKGGNALLYSASVVAFLSKAKLKTGEIEEDDLGGSGIKVSFKTFKQRFCRPKKVYAEISFANGLNKYSHLDYFCTPENFETVGIANGKKTVDEDGVVGIKPGGNFWYVRHLDKALSIKNLFNATVFTKEVLEALDPIIRDHFAFKDPNEVTAKDTFGESMTDDLVDITDTDEIDSENFFEED